MHKLRDEKELEFAAYQPRFIVDQVVATCRFMGQPPHFEPRYIDYALDNLRVKRSVAANPSPKPTPASPTTSALPCTQCIGAAQRRTCFAPSAGKSSESCYSSG